VTTICPACGEHSLQVVPLGSGMAAALCANCGHEGEVTHRDDCYRCTAIAKKYSRRDVARQLKRMGVL
jgi:hypothetical protein